MLMFFHRWLRPLLEGGHVEVVRPPWGEIIVADERSPRLAFSEPEFQSLADHLRGPGGIPGRPAGVARRYRGLAGIDAGILHATCVAPASRRTSRMTGGDVERMIALLDQIGSPDGPDA
jgi:DNA gyrase/topoisomerase IV subunit B